MKHEITKSKNAIKHIRKRDIEEESERKRERKSMHKSYSRLGIRGGLGSFSWIARSSCETLATRVPPRSLPARHPPPRITRLPPSLIRCSSSLSLVIRAVHQDSLSPGERLSITDAPAPAARPRVPCFFITTPACLLFSRCTPYLSSAPRRI